MRLRQRRFPGHVIRGLRIEAAFAIESTCHAPDRGDVYSEGWRVVKPEGLFTSYEWCLTDRYDATDPRHVTVKQELEEGNALPELIHTSAVLEALQRVGFEVVDSRDIADDSIPQAPWYLRSAPERRS